MAKSPTPTWLGLILVPVGLLLVAMLGMWVYMSTTAAVLHPNPQQAPSMTYSAPAAKWAGAMEQARQIRPCASQRGEPAGTFGGGRHRW